MIGSGQQNEHHVMASACFTVLYRDSHVTKESMHVCLHFKGTHAIIKSWFLSKLTNFLESVNSRLQMEEDLTVCVEGRYKAYFHPHKHIQRRLSQEKQRFNQLSHSRQQLN